MRPTTMFFALICAIALPCAVAAQQPAQRTQTQQTTQSTTRTTGPSTPAAPAAASVPIYPAPPAPPANGTRYLPINVRIDVTISDERNGQAPVKRTASVIAADGDRGSVRSQANVFGLAGSVPLDIDASPVIISDGHIKLQFTLNYDLPGAVPGTAPDQAKPGQVTRSTLTNSLTLVLADGKPLQVSQSADAIGDRKVSVEVTATILK